MKLCYEADAIIHLESIESVLQTMFPKDTPKPSYLRNHNRHNHRRYALFDFIYIKSINNNSFIDCHMEWCYAMLIRPLLTRMLLEACCMVV